MASIHAEISLTVGIDRAWRALRDVGRADLLFAGVLNSCCLENGIRTVTFASGYTVQERIVDIDDARRRVVYSVLGHTFQHHSASMQLMADEHGCRFIWISDFLPGDLSERIAPLIDAGCQALKRNLEAGS